MNWNAIKRFNFTHALTGGAWLEDASGYVNWESFTTISKYMGKAWIDRHIKKQGWMTGCWVDCDAPAEYPGTETDFAKDTLRNFTA